MVIVMGTGPLKKINAYFLRDRGDGVSGGGTEREGATESEAGSSLWVVSTEPDAGLELTNQETMT